MNYRKNLSGDATFMSAIPDSLFDANVVVDEALGKAIAGTEQALKQWNKTIENLAEEEQASMLYREAEISWMLSNGQTIGLFEPVWTPPSHSKEDAEDIANLEKATHWAKETMEEFPISRRLLSDAHYIACRSERYEKKYPGEFRTSPVWIGEKDSKLQDEGVFVPPVAEDMIAAFTDLERFIHYTDSVHPLVRVALAHYQFQTIHPFIDGNGRIGRLLSLLMLMDYGYTNQPILQLSEQFSRYSINYYALIQQTHLTGNHRDWVRFFLMCLRKAVANKDI